MGNVEIEACQLSKREALRRINQYKRPASLKQLRRRWRSLFGDDWGIERALTDMVKNDGSLRVANGVLYAPGKSIP